MWNLFRNPMLASVGLEGTDTVQGLKTIDRLRAAQLLDHGAPSSRTPKTKPASRRSYRRYKGPFIEFLGVDEFQRDPKAWADFFGTTPTAAATAARTFDVPGSLDALFERFDENIVCFLANYLRVGAAILLLCTYLRPKAVFGIALMAYNVYTGYRALATPSAPQSRHARTTTTPPAPANPAIAILTWFVMVYSKCVPIVALALLLSAISISLHASLRRTVSETRCRTGAKDNVSFSFRQVWKVRLMIIRLFSDSPRLTLAPRASLLRSLSCSPGPTARVKTTAAGRLACDHAQRIRMDPERSKMDLLLRPPRRRLDPRCYEPNRMEQAHETAAASGRLMTVLSVTPTV